jgi:hypothetical protein
MATATAYYSSVASNSGWSNPSYVQYDDSSYASSSDVLSTVVYNMMDTAPVGQTITSIRFYVKAKKIGAGAGFAKITISLLIGGSTYAKSATTLSTTETLYSYDWSGSWSKAQCDAMQFKIVGEISGTWGNYVNYIYSVQTYTPIPAAPTNVSTSESPCYDNQSVITWTKATDATKYQIYECTTVGGTYVVCGGELGDVAEGPTGIETTRITMYYKVKAGNVTGWSALSVTYATVIFVFGKTINEKSHFAAINNKSVAGITAWNGVEN